MKIIFLDVDGVLNIQSTTYYSHSYTELGNDPIEPHLMSRLEFILDRVPDAQIVISSSWVTSRLVKRLKQRRFKYIDRIYSTTPRDVEHRGNQIKKWLDEYAQTSPDSVTDYVVLEDEILDVCGSKCSTINPNKVIKVDMNEGLSNKNTIDTVKLLNINDWKIVSNVERLTKHNYYKYYDLGFRPNVVGDIDELVNKWDYFEVCEKTLTLIVKKSI